MSFSPSINFLTLARCMLVTSFVPLGPSAFALPLSPASRALLPTSAGVSAAGQREYRVH